MVLRNLFKNAHHRVDVLVGLRLFQGNVAHEPLHHGLGAGIRRTLEGQDRLVFSADLLPVRNVAVVDRADLFACEVRYRIVRFHEEDEGFLPDRCDTQLNVPVFRLLHLVSGRSRTEDDVGFFDEQPAKRIHGIGEGDDLAVLGNDVPFLPLLLDPLSPLIPFFNGCDILVDGLRGG